MRCIILLFSFGMHLLGGIELSAQPYTNLVLEGAGIRGIAYVGAIKAMEENRMLDQVEKVAGTSAGAIAALTISLGYSSKEIEDLIYGLRIQKFNDGRFLFAGGIARMNRNYGWYRGKAFRQWLEKIIRDKTQNENITFLELHDRKFKDLYITGTSLNHQKLLVFSYEQYPQMKVKDAVRISMSIPLYFEAVFIDSLGMVKTSKDLSSDHHLVVDGGVIGNFPITIFDSVAYKGGVTSRYPNMNTLGLRIDTPEQIAYDSLRKELAPVPIRRFKSYIAAFYNFVIENLNRGHLTPDDWRRTVSISSDDIGPKIRKLSTKEKDILVNNGYSAMLKFLSISSSR